MCLFQFLFKCFAAATCFDERFVGLLEFFSDSELEIDWAILNADATSCKFFLESLVCSFDGACAIGAASWCMEVAVASENGVGHINRTKVLHGDSLCLYG